MFGTFDLCYSFSLYRLFAFFVHMLSKEIENVKLEVNNFQLNFKVVGFLIVVLQSFSFLMKFSLVNENFIILFHYTIIEEFY